MRYQNFFSFQNVTFFFFHLKLNQFFLKEIVLVMRNCSITISEIEMVFRRADFRCSGSLYSMLLYKNCIGFKFSINIFWTKRMIHVHYVSTRWLVVSFLTGYLSEFGFSRYTFSRNDRLNRHNVWVFTSCAGR